MNVLQAVSVIFILWLTLIVCCAGCQLPPVLELPPDQQAVKDATLEGWADAGLPDPGECLRRARVQWARTAEEFAGTCRYPVSMAAACLQQDVKQVGLVVHGAPVAFLRPGEPLTDASTGSVAAHEWLHALHGCVFGPLDAGHQDARVWLFSGGASSAQGRMRERLRLSRPQ